MGKGNIGPFLTEGATSLILVSYPPDEIPLTDIES